MADTLRYLIEALRNKPTAPGIYREPGRPPRQQRGTPSLSATNKRAQYDRYIQIQNQAGEDPVSYEEWMMR